jgi:hypothetical protein
MEFFILSPYIIKQTTLLKAVLLVRMLLSEIPNRATSIKFAYPAEFVPPERMGTTPLETKAENNFLNFNSLDPYIFARKSPFSPTKM